METVSMFAALFAMALVVVVKVGTSRLVSQMKQRIANVEQDKRRILGELKASQSQSVVAAKNKATLEKKKVKLEGKKTQLNRELADMQKDAGAREQKRAAARGKLVRPT